MSAKEKIYIFLDVDGVLNSDRYIEILNKDGYRGDTDREFDPIVMKCLKDLVRYKSDKYKYQFVISSSWRVMFSDCDYIEKCLISSNIISEYDFVDRTPVFRDGPRKKRSEEISAYCDLYNIPEENIIIIDDDEYDLLDLKGRLIKCNQKYGFDKSKLKEAKRLIDESEEFKCVMKKNVNVVETAEETVNVKKINALKMIQMKVKSILSSM